MTRFVLRTSFLNVSPRCSKFANSSKLAHDGLNKTTSPANVHTKVVAHHCTAKKRILPIHEDLHASFSGGTEVFLDLTNTSLCSTFMYTLHFLPRARTCSQHGMVKHARFRCHLVSLPLTGEGLAACHLHSISHGVCAE